MKRARVLIVDDSSLVRRALTDALAAEPDFEVVGAAASGSIAIAKMTWSPADLVTVGPDLVDAAELDLIAEIRKRSAAIVVVPFDAQPGHALSLGPASLASAAGARPGVSAAESMTERVRARFAPRLRAALARYAPSLAAPLPEPVPPQHPSPRPLAVLAIGCSTGGPNALEELFRQIPATLPVPVLIAQHMPPVFTKMLADRLSAACPLRFHEAREGDVIAPGGVWIAPGDFHMRVACERGSFSVALDKGPHVNSCRPSVDVLFRSIADAFGGRTLALVLTGMGQDGLHGAEAIHARGGSVLVQDEATSVVWGMPGFIAKAGLARAILPLPLIANEVVAQVMAHRTRAGATAEGRRAS